MPSTAHARALRPAEVMEQRRAEELAARSAGREANFTVVGIVAGLVAQLVAIVWFAATLNAKVDSLRADVPPGAVATILAKIEGIEGRLDRGEVKP